MDTDIDTCALGTKPNRDKRYTGDKNTMKEIPSQQPYRGEDGSERNPVVAVRCVRFGGDYCMKFMIPRQIEVFTKLGYEIEYVEEDYTNKEWDVLWSYGYPFPTGLFNKLFRDKVVVQLIENLQPGQKVNHFPGEGAFVHKQTLCTSGLKHIPKTFELPRDEDAFNNYNENNPKPYWVEKRFTNRGVKIIEHKDIDYSKDVLVQEFIHNPLLLDGYMFDIGIYVVVTSVNPLRVYVHDNEWRIKVSNQKYYPFDLSQQEKYVLPGNQMQHLDEIPALQNYFNQSTEFSYKDIFMMYMKDEGYDVGNIENKMSEAIREMFLHTESFIVEESSNYNFSTRHCFGLYRTDFIITDTLDVKLIETNMSPSITSGKKEFNVNKHRLFYNVLSLVGLDNPVLKNQYENYSESASIQMQVMSSDIGVFKDECIKQSCYVSCEPDVCKFCWNCLSDSNKADMQAAFLEHKNKQSFRRIFPQPYHDGQEEARENQRDMSGLNEKNAWMTEWFRGKCLQSASWCQ